MVLFDNRQILGPDEWISHYLAFMYYGCFFFLLLHALQMRREEAQREHESDCISFSGLTYI